MRQKEADSWHRLIVHRTKRAQVPLLTTLLFQTYEFIQSGLRNTYMQDMLSELTGYRLLLDPLVLASEEAAKEQPPPFLVNSGSQAQWQIVPIAHPFLQKCTFHLD